LALFKDYNIKSTKYKQNLVEAFTLLKIYVKKEAFNCIHELEKLVFLKIESGPLPAFLFPPQMHKT